MKASIQAIIHAALLYMSVAILSSQNLEHVTKHYVGNFQTF